MVSTSGLAGAVRYRSVGVYASGCLTAGRWQLGIIRVRGPARICVRIIRAKVASCCRVCRDTSRLRRINRNLWPLWLTLAR